MRSETETHASAQAGEHDVVRGTFYGLNFVCLLIFGAAGFVLPPAWLVAGFCLVAMLGGREAEQRKASMEAERGRSLDQRGRSGGCALSLVLVVLLAGVFFVALLGGGLALP